jgi:acyl transferase domain-containing protein/NADPH:quinone reductase-like Zn-dependent oxidoreductase
MTRPPGGAAAEPIAIVGMGCRLPGAGSPEAYWTLLRDGAEAVGDVPPDRWDAEALYDPDPAAPGRLVARRGGFVAHLREFDAAFFGISPREARRVDPQQRLLLEVCWEALEDGGQAPDRIAGAPVGVFVGISSHDYADIASRPGAREQIDAYVPSGGAASIAANRLSYLLDLRGPSLAVDTACSSALTAVHLACRSLAAGECALAVAAGVNVLLAPEVTIGFSKAGMLSPSGRCRPFDASADGYVRSEGAGAVVLKPLRRALADGDRVRAVIRGTAVNQDGRTTGLSVPSPDAQESLLRSALRAAGVRPRDVAYVEAHGTGTPVGDPAEATAIGRVMGGGRPAGAPCLIGSAKGNVGHLEAAAGIAGLIKAALSLERGEIPASLHLEEPTPAVDWDGLHLRVAARRRPWPEGPRLAAVNSFGFGGANACAVLEAAAGPPAGAGGGPWILPLSARDPAALGELARRWAGRLAAGDGPVPADAARTAALRAHHPHRLAAVGGSAAELAERLEEAAAGRTSPEAARGEGTSGRVAFVFPGMGAQWPGMGSGLAAREPVVRRSLAESDRLLRPLSGWSLLDELAAPEGASRVARAEVAHVANLAVQLALVALLESWGVRPDAVVGHSSGEAAAACAAGALEPGQALALAFHRGRLQARTEGRGGMLAVVATEEEAAALAAGHPGRVGVAAVNGPTAVTLSGDDAALADIAAALARRGRQAVRLPVEVPYHGPQMDELRDDLLAALAGLRPGAAGVPLVSTVTGEWLNGEPMDASYWWRNVRQPVRFARAVERLGAEGIGTVLEVGPQPVLGGAVRAILAAGGVAATVLCCLRRDRDEPASMLSALAGLYAGGAAVDWPAVVGGRGRIVSMPAYPWRREHHWAEEPPDGAAAPEAGVAGAWPLLGRRLRAPAPAWQVDLGARALDWLDGHVVQGVTTFPAAGYVDMALCAGRDMGLAVPGIADLRLEALLGLPARPGHVLRCSSPAGDGALEFHGAPAGAAPDWTLHARATAVDRSGARPPGREDLDALRARCGAPLDAGSFYRRAEERHGLSYRGAFRGMTELRVGSGEALGSVGSPEVDPAGHAVHPALLDAAFQVAAAAIGRGPGAPRGLVLPVGIDAVTLHAAPGTRAWAHARVDQEPGGDWRTTVRLLDDEGVVLLTCDGLRLRAAATPRGRGLADLVYREAWEPSPLAERAPEAAAFDPAAIAARAAPAMERIAGALGVAAYYTSVEPALEEMAGRHAAGDDAAVAAMGERVAAAHPAYRSFAALVRRSAEHLAGAGGAGDDAREWLFRGSAWDSLVEAYSEAPPFRATSEVVAEAVALAADDAGRPLRVLEVGAGTGATTAAVLAREPAVADYLATDLSPFLVRRARERLGHVPGLRFGVLDVERPPEAGEGTFDIVIGANVVHATRDLRASLANLRARLLPGGLLMLQEGLRPAAWLDLVFGQLEGWWLFADADLRPHHPLATSAAWRTALADAGFDAVEELADAGPAGGPPVQALLLARAPSAPRRSRRRVVVGGGGRVAAVVADALAEAGHPCVPLAAARGGEGATAAAVLSTVEGMCGEVVALVRAIAPDGLPPELWLVTAGAHRLDGDGPSEPAQASLWGLGRVVRSERPDLRLRMIDLPREPTSADLAALVAEIGAGDRGPAGEDEIAVRAGAPHVRRLRRAPARESLPAPRRLDPERARFRLHVGAPGALDSLVLREEGDLPLAPGDVEIRVAAAALNFKDVLVALGMMVPRSPAEEALGAECAGVVARCGADVEGLRPGDPVVALAGGAFGSVVRAPAALVARAPAGLALEESATMPGAFATAIAAIDHVARVVPGERVLIHSAAGGFGLAAVQVARRAGARILATASTPEKQAYLRSLGAEQVMDSRSLAFADEVMDATGGEGVDVVLNSLGGEALARSVGLLRNHGRFVELGRRDLDGGARLGLAPFARGLSFSVLRLALLAEERPAWVGALLREMVAGAERGELEPLPHVVMDLADAGEAFRTMAQGRHIGRILLTPGEPDYPVHDAPGASPWRADATYLIAGGLGGLGLSLAERMARRGARHLVLAGRRGGPRPEEEPALAAVRASGAEIVAARCDATDEGELSRLLEEIRRTMPPIRGVVHAAMVLDDAPIARMDAARLLAALAPKVAAGWALHRATRRDDLDHFVLLSSLSGVMGTPGQANYAAGNAFLSSLAQHRRALGLPALVLDLGAVADAGHVARHASVQEFFSRAGVDPVEPLELWDVLEDCLRRGVDHRMVARIDWAAWTRGPAAAVTSAAVADLARSAEDGPAPDASDAPDVARLLAMPAPERREAVLRRVLAQAARVTGLAPGRLDPARALVDVGLDSLMAAELAAGLQRELGAGLSLARILDGMSLEDITTAVLDQVGG